MTSLKQISLFTEDKLIYSQEDSLANHIQVQESDLAKKMRDISGLKCCEQLEKFNHVGLWAKMFVDLLIGMEGWYSTKCNLIWKIKATKSHRIYFQLQPSMLPTEEIGFGLLPTPLASEGGKMSGSPTENQMSLTKLARNQMLPTPTAMDSTNATANMKSTQVKEGSMHSVTLMRAMSMGMLPTPTLQDARIGPNNIGGSKHRMERGSIALADIALGLTKMLPTPNARDWKDSIGNGKDAPSIGLTRGYSLGQKINSMLPTPQAQEGEKITGKENQDSLTKRARQMSGKTSQLNPLFVEEMMGFPENWTASPFQNGGKNL
jgi:hypothetical protein